jgi:hypothetical protein
MLAQNLTNAHTLGKYDFAIQQHEIHDCKCNSLDFQKSFLTSPPFLTEDSQAQDILGLA